MKKELTPAQSYLLEAFRVLSAIVAGDDISEESRAAVMARPATLKSAINAAFYKSVGLQIAHYL